MAYDQNGIFYFDPTDVDDVEKLREAQERKYFDSIRDAGEEQGQIQKFMGNAWNEALEHAGLTQEEYNQLYALDPENAKALVKTEFKNLTTQIASRKKGRSPAKRLGGPAAKRDSLENFIRPTETLHERSEGNQKIVEQARQTVEKKGQLSSDEELDVLMAVLKG